MIKIKPYKEPSDALPQLIPHPEQGTIHYLKGNLYNLTSNRHRGMSFILIIPQLAIFDHLEYIKLAQVQTKIQEGYMLFGTFEIFFESLDQLVLTLRQLAL